MRGQFVRSKRRRGLIALAVAFGALALPSAASAVPLTVPFVGFGLPPAANTTAGDETEYTVSFVAQNGLSGGSTAVIINAAGAPPLAAGTTFPPSALHSDEGAFYTVGTADDPNNVVIADVIRQNGDQTVIIPIAFTGLSASVNEVVTVGIGYGSDHKVHNRPTPCDDCRLAIDTTMAGDDFGLTPAFDVLEGPGDLLVESGNDQVTMVATAFGDVLEAHLVDGLGADVVGENVTFTAPPTGPSGTFAGGTMDGRELVVVTDGDGIATSSVLTANDAVGVWAVDVTTDAVGVAPIEFDLENDPGPPEAVTLQLSPSVIPGDGVSTSQATATVEDQFGNQVDAGNTATFSSDGAQEFSPPTEIAPGRFRSTITSTPESGLFTITVDIVEGSSPSDTAALAQTADVTAPRAEIRDHPQRRSKRKRARFTFDSGSSPSDQAECKLDGAAYRPCTSPKTYRVRRGRHVFKVRSTDLSGNTGPADTFTFRRTKRN